MTGIITEILDYKSLKRTKVIIAKEDKPKESVLIDFTGRIRTLLLSGFKANDRVNVTYEEYTRKDKQNYPHGNRKATSIYRL